MTTLANFRNQLDPIVFQAAKNHYKGGHILQLKQFDRNYWLASVEGRDIYQVAVTIEDDRQLIWRCGCGDSDPICEHVAAVLLALEDQLGSAPVKKGKKPGRKKSGKADMLREVVAYLSREEVDALLVKQALKDEGLQNMLLAEPHKERKYGRGAKGDVRDILQAVQGKHKFIDYWGAAEAADGLLLLLDLAQEYLETGRTAHALRIFKAVIEEVVPALAHADDSMGALSECVQFAFDGLMMAADELDKNKRALLFKYCLQKARQEPFTDWDWIWDLAGIAGALVETSEQRQVFFSALDEMANRRSGQGWAAEYDWERAALLKIAIYQREGNSRAAHDFLVKHQHKERMQFVLALLYIEEGNLDEARKIGEAWLAKPRPDIPALKPDFLAALLEIAEIEGDLEKQKSLLWNLYVETGEIEYFDMLEELYDDEEWPELRRKILRHLDSSDQLWMDTGQLFVEEKMWPELADFVLAKPKAAPTYHQYLAKEYPHELSQAYEKLARETLQVQVSRKGYRQVCCYLRKMQELGEAERVKELVTGWRLEYKQRHALQEELDRSFGGG